MRIVLYLSFLLWGSNLWSQFVINDWEYDEKDYYEGIVLGTIRSHFFFVESNEFPDAAEKINEFLYKEILETSYKKNADPELYFPVYDEHSAKQAIDYEIIESSELFLTLRVTYKRPYKDHRSQRYYSFMVKTGEVLTWNVFFDYDSYEDAAEYVFEIY